MKNIHWAEFAADKIIREKGDKETYTLASGITPSGTVHFGNFREVMTVELVARALIKKGKKVRFIFSWDDYDTFRKVPKNMPNPKELEKYLFQPIVDTPDPYGLTNSYARHHEINFEQELIKLGIQVEYLYQAQKYRNGDYQNSIRIALNNKDKIKEILNEHRRTPLGEDYLPVSVYCEKCNTDHKINKKTYENNQIKYTCDNCTHTGNLSLSSGRIKLPWRIDWAMRWAYESVDFEPGGKDHSSEGGSFTTAKKIVNIFGGEAPVYLKYDFVSINGGAGKMSSSSGDVLTVSDLLKIYSPKMVRWIYASYKPNLDFKIDLEMGVLKKYEEFKREQELAYGLVKGNDKKTQMAKVVNELISIDNKPYEKTLGIRELSDTLQTFNMSIDNTLSALSVDNESTHKDLLNRVSNWIKLYSPEEFKFNINETSPQLSLGKEMKLLLNDLSKDLEKNFNNHDGKTIQELIYSLKNKYQIEVSEVFKTLYQILISKDKGPRLGSFILTIPKDKVLQLINNTNSV